MYYRQLGLYTAAALSVIVILSFCQLTPTQLRIVSLTPATTEILFALGLGNNTVGVTTYCNYPAEALTKTKIGSFSQPNIETIINLKPDLVLATDLEQAPVVNALKKLHIHVISIAPQTMAELFTSIKTVGAETYHPKEANLLIQKMKQTVQKIKNKTANLSANQRKKVFVEISHDPLMTAGKGSFVDELITIAGGINIANDTRRPYSLFSVEQVIIRNPDVILLGYMNNEQTKETVSQRAGWNNISAVQNNQIITNINPDIFLRPGPRLIEGLEKLYERLH